MNKLTFLISNIDKSFHFEWLSEYLDSSKFEIGFILIGQKRTKLEQFLRDKDHRLVIIDNRRNMLNQWLIVIRTIATWKPDIIHVHLFLASILGLSAGYLLGTKRRIITRHHGSLHHDYFPRAVWYDKVLNRLATDIVVLSQNHRKLLIEIERANRSKVHLIPHGFNLKDFQNIEEKRVNQIRRRYNFPVDKKFVGVISRFTLWKGVQYVIAGFERLLETNRQFHLVLANATGDAEDELFQMLDKLPRHSYTLIKFEEDIISLYKIFDYCVHVPVNSYAESFGQVYVEALIMGVPSIFTPSGIANDFITNRSEAMIVPFKDSDAIFESILILEKDSVLKKKMVVNGKAVTQDLFNLEGMIAKLEKLYLGSNKD